MLLSTLLFSTVTGFPAPAPESRSVHRQAVTPGLNKNATPAALVVRIAPRRKSGRKKSVEGSSSAPASGAADTTATPAPTPGGEAASMTQVTTSSISSVAPVPTPGIIALTQPTGLSPGISPADAMANQSSRPTLSLPVIFTLLCLILFALIVVLFKLKKQLRAP
jgi:hypothetical protein